ncbi:MAG: Mrp/NBP35 family ATP-binding protein [Campylobacterota bacterium]|nr:Mrp/NBP35 family ATP-binding protein [Campylobacterota bacterium]
MNSQELKSEIESIVYPGITRTLGELNLISTVKLTDNRVSIELLTVSEDSYLSVKKVIEEQLESRFDSLNITKKNLAQKDMNFGNTARPNNRAPYAKNIIAVTSGKGGVGKSTVSVNLAVALAQKGFKVGLLDADVYGPNIPRLTQTDLERIKWNDDNKIIPSENYGLKIMSVGLTTPTMDTPLVWRSSVAVSALTQFLEDVAWGELDFMVIDMPPGTGDIQLTMAEELPITASVIVTTPQLISTDDVSRAIMMFKDIKVPMAGIVENMSYFIAPDTGNRYDIFGSGGGEKIAAKYEVPLLGQIPLNMQIREYSDQGQPPVAMGNEEEKSYYTNILDKMFKAINFKI